jgi:hypothetical protein
MVIIWLFKYIETKITNAVSFLWADLDLRLWCYTMHIKIFKNKLYIYKIV